MSLKMLINLLLKSIIRNLVFLGVGELKDGNDSHLFVFVKNVDIQNELKDVVCTKCTLTNI